MKVSENTSDTQILDMRLMRIYLCMYSGQWGFSTYELHVRTSYSQVSGHICDAYSEHRNYPSSGLTNYSYVFLINQRLTAWATYCSNWLRFGPRSVSARLKQLECKIVYEPPSSAKVNFLYIDYVTILSLSDAEVKNVWNCITTSQHIFVSRCLIKHMYNVALCNIFMKV
jgi:hypothetical protein